MKFYKDKDSYVYNKSLYDKQKRKDFLTRLKCALLVLNIIFSSGVIANNINYSFKRINPFDGQSISSSDFISNYKAEKSKSFLEDEDFKDVIDSIKNSNMDEKKAYLLYYALLSNDSLTEEEKKNLTGYIQYFIDNKYLDYEYVYNRLSNLKVGPINKDLGAAGTTNLQYNTINFDSEESRKTCITHEIFHLEDKSGKILSYGDYAWFLEGLTSVLNYEYFDRKDDGYDFKADFIRILCLFIGSDKLLETRATGNIDILIDALIEKGIEKEKIEEMFYLLNKYNFEENKTSIESGKLIFEVQKILFECYNIIYNNPEFINPLFYNYFSQMGNPYIQPSYKTDENIYFFNKRKVNKVFNSIYYHNDHEIVVIEYYDSYLIKKIYENNNLISTKKDQILMKDVEKKLNLEKNYTK